LIDKLICSEYELSGLLNLALKGLGKLMKEGGFKDVSVEKIRQEYEHNSSIVKQFVEEQCVVNLNNPDYFVSTWRLKDLFRIFCKTRGSKPLDENILGKELLQIGITKERPMRNRKRDYCYIGITPREDLQSGNEALITT
jgi:phage/plasmid-associated DNA primase